MKYYIAGDGGGTKLQVILYDENLHVVNSARMSGTNTIHRSTEAVKEDMRNLIRELIPTEIKEIERADLCILRYEKEFLELLKERCTVNEYSNWDEGMTHVLSTGNRYAVVAQAGTGSDAFMIQPDLRKAFGGWGFILGDEGSGYDIGRNSLRASLRYAEGRAPKTMIYDMLAEEWGIERYWDLVSKVYNYEDYRSLIASVARTAAKAAQQNDPVALQIYEDAGHTMAEGVLDAIEYLHGTWEGPIVASGGAWKGCSRMFETFCEDIRAKYPDAWITRPIYDPVVGCIIGGCFKEGKEFADVEAIIAEQFGEFRCY